MRAASSPAQGQGRGGAQAAAAAGGGRPGGPQNSTNSNFHSRKSSNASNSSVSQPHNNAAGAGGPAAGSNAASAGPSGPASSSNASAANNNTPVSPLALSELLGAQLRLTLNVGNRDKERPIVTGALWCYDPAYGSLVLSSPNTSGTPGSSYRIVRLSSIQSVQVLSEPARESVQVDIKAINPDRIREREQQGVAAEQKRLANQPPPGVSELGKELFEALGKTMPVRWAGTTMLVDSSLPELLCDH